MAANRNMQLIVRGKIIKFYEQCCLQNSVASLPDWSQEIQKKKNPMKLRIIKFYCKSR